MSEEVLFETEARQPRGEVAAYLRTVADRLDGGGDLTLSSDGDSVTLSVPERPEFEVKAEREGPADGSGELSVEFEIEWREGGDGGDGSLTIE